ncbi:MAG: hypothetical protein JWN88_2643 [Frankiales bacterium]|jgi:hypothetical protein|nr:hypothetical protein [Frankiales bacterium]
MSSSRAAYHRPTALPRRRHALGAAAALAGLLGASAAMAGAGLPEAQAQAASPWTCQVDQTSVVGDGAAVGPHQSCMKVPPAPMPGPTSSPAPPPSAPPSSPAPTTPPVDPPPAPAPAAPTPVPPPPVPAPVVAPPATTVAAALTLPGRKRGPDRVLAAAAAHDRKVQLGQLTQTTLDAAPEGTVFGLASGVHRLTAPLVPRRGQAFVGLGDTTVSGARALSGWTPSGGAWYVGGQTQQLPVRDSGGVDTCEPYAPLCERVEDVFADNQPLRQVGTRGEVVAGSFWFDDAADRIWVGSDPSGRAMETTLAVQAFVRGNDNLFRDLVVEKFANPAQSGALHGTGLKIERSTVRLNHGTGIFNYGGRIVDSLILDNGQMGLGAGGGGQLVQNNEIARNGREGYDAGWEAGGTKWAFSNDLVVRGNWSHHNTGNGLWTDISNVRSLYEGNLVEDNGYNGIFHEISHSATIQNNVTRRNGTRDTYFSSRQGINVTGSRGVVVTGNVVQDNGGGGILAVQDQRTGGSPEGSWTLEGLDVRNNDIRMSNGYSGIWIYDAVADRSSYFTTRGNRFTGNRYQVSDLSRTWFLGGDAQLGAAWEKTWARWQQLGGDAGGSLTAS